MLMGVFKGGNTNKTKQRARERLRGIFKTLGERCDMGTSLEIPF